MHLHRPLEPAPAALGELRRFRLLDETEHTDIKGPRRVFSASGDGELDVIDRFERHPTLPSSEIATSFCASTANSIGSSCSTSRTKPLTSRATASSCESPRCMA